jgi:hypothetical protein
MPVPDTTVPQDQARRLWAGERILPVASMRLRGALRLHVSMKLAQTRHRIVTGCYQTRTCLRIDRTRVQWQSSSPNTALRVWARNRLLCAIAQQSSRQKNTISFPALQRHFE